MTRRPPERREPAPERGALEGRDPSGAPPPGVGRLSRRAALRLGAALAFSATGALPEARAQLVPANAAPRAPLPAPSDGTVEVLHGLRVEDPFRPLEDLGRPDVRAWIAAEDQAAQAMLHANPLHAKVAAFTRATLRYRRTTGSRRIGSGLLSTVQDGSREQAWLELASANGGEPRVVIDPNAMAPDGSLHLANYYPDRSGNRLAYLLIEYGGDAQRLRIRDLRTATDLPDRLEGCRFTSVVWLPEGNAFYYTRPPLPGDPAGLDRTSHQIYYHRLGEPQSADRLVWHLEGERNVAMSLRSSNAQLIVLARLGTDEKHGMWLAPLAQPGQPEMLVPMGRASFWLIQAAGTTIFAHTDLDAPRGRIIRFEVGEPRTEAWRTIVPEGDGVIDGASIVSGRLVVRRFRNLGHQIAVHTLEGRKLYDVPFEDAVRINFERNERSGGDFRLEVDDRRRPVRQVRLNVQAARIEQVPGPQPPHTLDDVEVRTVTARSADGTEVPVTLMSLPGVKADGSNRTLLYGYGSYGISQHPAYSSLAAAWVRLGGIYAVATIRGGAEFGRDWHEAGRFANKRNAVADFIAAAEHLVGMGLTRPARLGLYGASSGGRLVLGTMVARPELAGAVVAGVALIDMLRFHRHTFGVAWTQEYGDPERADDFRWLHALSPLHNIRPGVAYPPLLLLTGDNDQRVVPSHSYKFAAMLRRAAPEAEVYVRTRRGAGHGTGNGLSKSIEFQADVVSFLTHRLGGPVRELPRV